MIDVRRPAQPFVAGLMGGQARPYTLRAPGGGVIDLLDPINWPGVQPGQRRQASFVDPQGPKPGLLDAAIAQKTGGAGAAGLPAGGGSWRERVGNFLGSDAALALAAGMMGGQGTTGEAIGQGLAAALKVRQAEKAAAAKEQPGIIGEFLAAKKAGLWGGDLPGFIAMKKPPGTTVNVSGDKLTEGQSKDINYYSRGSFANKELEQYENELTSLRGAMSENLGTFGNYAQSPEYQKAKRAGNEFLAVILRKDTGAAVTPAEFDLYGPMYLPWPGDSDEAVASKKLARKRALDAIKLGLGTARGLTEEIDAQVNAITFDTSTDAQEPLPPGYNPRGL